MDDESYTEVRKHKFQSRKHKNQSRLLDNKVNTMKSWNNSVSKFFFFFFLPYLLSNISVTDLKKKK